MLDQNGDESFNRAEDGSVDDHRAGHTRLECVLIPGEVLIIMIVLGIVITSECLLFALFVSLSRVMGEVRGLRLRKLMLFGWLLLR